MTEKDYLDYAQDFAEYTSGCKKVHVGAVIVKDGKAIKFGANRTEPVNCRSAGCLRIQRYGNNDKTHRGPADCRAIHAEVAAIANAEENLSGATIYVTRYPCEACARLIVYSGISRVVYGRQQKISDMTKEIFDCAGITVEHIKDWDAPDAQN